MNKEAEQYWENFWQGKEKPTNVICEQFGNEEIADELASLIVSGKKTATCSAHILYELENQPIPKVGEYTIVLDRKDAPVAIIKTTEVQLVKMNEVAEELASKEGEGDLSYQYWYDGHKRYFTAELKEHGLEFAEDMLLIFEKFDLVDVK